MIFILIEKVKVEKIKGAEYNPRKDLQETDKKYNEIKNSLETFGMLEPIIWNKITGNIIGGHQRFKILKMQGATEIECSVVDFDLDEENPEEEKNGNSLKRHIQVKSIEKIRKLF